MQNNYVFKDDVKYSFLVKYFESYVMFDFNILIF